MKVSKRKKLEAAGWKVGSTAEFLGLSKAEEALVEMKLALANDLKERRRKKRLTQTQFAKRIGSSQSRVAKMEAADRSVSVDFFVRSLLSLGVSSKVIGAVMGTRVQKKKTARQTKRKVVGS